MALATHSELVDVEVSTPSSVQKLNLRVSTKRILRDVLRAGASGFGLANAQSGFVNLQIRREGDLLPMNTQQLAGQVLRAGDRLIIEPAVCLTSAVGRGVEAAGLELNAGGEAFTSAASRLAGSALSASSLKFLAGAEQITGE